MVTAWLLAYRKVVASLLMTVLCSRLARLLKKEGVTVARMKEAMTKTMTISMREKPLFLRYQVRSSRHMDLLTSSFCLVRLETAPKIVLILMVRVNPGFMKPGAENPIP
ncbi:MAG: hypothetical protein QW358_00635 [Candidatus Hadarchaeum sp.]